jgi:hypothetical protein
MSRRLRLLSLQLILVVAAMLGACKEEDPQVINKLDPLLKQQVDRLEGTMLSVILRVDEELTDDQNAVLSRHGVIVQSHIGTIYVCQIPLKAMLPVARESFVARLEAPKELKPF